MLIDHSFTWLYGLQFGSVVIFFSLYCKFHTSTRFVTISKPLCLLVFCLTIEEHEFDPVSTFYSSIFKTGLFLMISGQSGNLIYNCLVSTLVPLMVIVGFYVSLKAKTKDDLNYQSDQINVIYARYVFVSSMLLTSYYLMLTWYKAQFVKSQLHLRNELSVTQMMDKISEPVIIIKKNRKHLNPKFKNEAAQQILPIEQESNFPQVDPQMKQNQTKEFTSLGSDNDSSQDELDSPRLQQSNFLNDPLSKQNP